jgi:hypothetical protein
LGAAKTNHPIFAPLGPWLGLERSLDALNRCADAQGVTNERGQPIRFAAVSDNENYELRINRTGCVATRLDNLHDWFNALVWLAFPRTKARLNAMHAAEIPREGGRRGRLRDMLTIFDEGGALVVSDDAELIELVREMRWRDLFWTYRERLQRDMRFVVVGHAVLEQALKPWPGITCKAIFVSPQRSLDEQAAAWLAACGPQATPRDLAPLPVFGYPGWLPASDNAEFYADERYFRSLRQGKAG